VASDPAFPALRGGGGGNGSAAPSAPGPLACSSGGGCWVLARVGSIHPGPRRKAALGGRITTLGARGGWEFQGSASREGERKQAAAFS